MENLQQDQTLKVIVGIGIFFSAISGIINLLRYLEEKEIARKQRDAKIKS